MNPPLLKLPRSKRLWIYICIAIAVICILVSLVIGWNFRVKGFSVEDVIPNNTDTRKILVGTYLISVDPAIGTAVLDWFIMGDTCCPESGPCNCSNVNIFFDTNLLKANDGKDSKPPSSGRPSDPIFRWNTTATEDLGANTPAFRTDITLFPKSQEFNFPDRNLQSYPFDQYFGVIHAFGVDETNNDTVAIYKNATGGVAVGFIATISPVGLDDVTRDKFLIDTIEFKRSGLVKAYCISIVISVWVITLIFLALSIRVVFNHRQPAAVLAIPVATLFTITSLRATMPGAPGSFGAIIDFVGILPCLSITALCAAVTLFLTVLGIAGSSAENDNDEEFKKDT